MYCGLQNLLACDVRKSIIKSSSYRENIRLPCLQYNVENVDDVCLIG